MKSWKHSKLVDKLIEVSSKADREYDKTAVLDNKLVKQYLRLTRQYKWARVWSPFYEREYPLHWEFDLSSVKTMSDQEVTDALAGRLHYCSDRLHVWRLRHIRALYKEWLKRGQPKGYTIQETWDRIDKEQAAYLAQKGGVALS